MADAYFFRAFRFSFQVVHTGGEIQFDYDCIGYLLQGKAEILYKGSVFHVKAGDVIFIPRGTQYYSVWHGTPDICFYSFQYRFPDFGAAGQFGFQIVDGFDRTLPDRIYDFYVKKRIYGALGELFRFADRLYEVMTPSGEGDSRLAPAVAYLEDHYNEKITVGDLAAMCFMSESHFYARFKKQFAVSPVVYKNNLAVQHALELLKQTELSVEEVGLRTGFSSPEYFRRTVRKFTGKLPKELR